MVDKLFCQDITATIELHILLIKFRCNYLQNDQELFNFLPMCTPFKLDAFDATDPRELVFSICWLLSELRCKFNSPQ